MTSTVSDQFVWVERDSIVPSARTGGSPAIISVHGDLFQLRGAADVFSVHLC